jgi:large subunit ribosomal protein L5
MATTLEKLYKDEIVPRMMEEFKYKSVMQVPTVEKICLNQGVGEATQDKKLVDVYQKEMTSIAGQMAVTVETRKSVSNFKLREGMVIGVRVTLRRDKMFEFLDRLISVALPRVRDFRGVSDKSFDGRGNYSMGITEQIIFPEIDIDKISKINGMDITIVTSAKTDAEAMSLLKLLGMPFKNQQKN